MINRELTKLAFRNRARGVVVATTGSVSLSATATGFARAAGSFVTDGFAEGEEFVAAGFGVAGNNGPWVITNVQPLTITTSTAPTAEGAAGGRTLTVGLPLQRSWENKTLTPLTGRPYIDENFVPATKRLIGLVQSGYVEETGLYIITLFGLENADTGGINKVLDALAALFSPGTVVVAAGIPVYVRGDQSTQAGQIIPLGNGWAASQLKIPWRATSLNAVAA